MKRFFQLALAMVLGLWMLSVTAWADEITTISSLDDLKAFALSVNEGNSYSGVTVTLTADIDLGGSPERPDIREEWTSIGRFGYPFQGTFDGGNHKITGLFINRESSNNLGLFCAVGNNGEVKNLAVEGSVTGSSVIGGVVGYNEGKVTDCSYSGSVEGSSDVGGVVGNNRNMVENCFNVGSVTGGGSAGGVVGINSNGTVENCYNTGSVTGSRNVGGVAGENSGLVENCYNIGSVKGSMHGGVVGENDRGRVINCYYLTGTAEEGIGTDSSSSQGPIPEDGTKSIEDSQLEGLAEKLGSGWVIGATGHPELISNRETSDEDDGDDGEDDPTVPEDPEDPTDPDDPSEEEPSEEIPGSSGGNSGGDDKEEHKESSERGESKEEPAEDANYQAEEAAMKAVETAMEAIGKGSSLAAAKLQEAATAAGTTIPAVPVKMYGLTARLSLDSMETMAAAPVGLKIILDGGAAEVLIPGGFALAKDPGRLYYPLAYQKNPYGTNTMLSLVKGESSKTEVYRVGGGGLPTLVTVTIKTKLSGPVNIYIWNEETRKVTLVATATADGAKVTFATRQMGNFILTTGSI